MWSVGLLSLCQRLWMNLLVTSPDSIFVLIFTLFQGCGWEVCEKSSDKNLKRLICVERLLVRINFVFYFQSFSSISLCCPRFVIHFADLCSVWGYLIVLVIFLFTTYIRPVFLLLFYFG